MRTAGDGRRDYLRGLLPGLDAAQLTTSRPSSRSTVIRQLLHSNPLVCGGGGGKPHASFAIFANNDMKVPQIVACKNLDDDEKRFHLIVGICCLFD